MLLPFHRKPSSVTIPFLKAGEEEFVTGIKGTLKDRPRQQIRWIADAEGRVVGMIAFGPDVDECGEDCWWIHRLMIRPEERRKRHAFLAVQAVLDEAPIGTEILTSIRPKNRSAQRLFRSLKFIPTRRRWDTETVWRFRKRRYWK